MSVNKPSDGMMLFVLLGVALFFLWVMTRAGKVSEASGYQEPEDEEEADMREQEEEYEGDDEEEYEPVQIDPGIKFVGKGYLAAVALIVLGVVLITGFQALYPGH